MTTHLPPNLRKALLAAGAFTVLAVAPAALAAPVLSTQAPIADKAQYTQTAEKQDRRGDRSRNRGDRTRDRGDRSRNRGDRTRDRGDRSRNRADRSRSRDRNWSRQNNRSRNRTHYRPSRSYRAPRYTSSRRNYRPYRSNVGISFNFGNSGYNPYRWSRSAHSFYQPTYGSYGYYQNATVCHRVRRMGWHYGHQRLISVKQCSNPWDGTYYIQGSERLAHRHH